MSHSRIIQERIGAWSHFVDVVTSWPGFRNWAFRGQADAGWQLQSSLSRHIKISGVCEAAWPLQEARIRRIFERKAHLFINDPPRDELEWLALMQHHGAPTRLLDLTWSPYVAAFFALERATNDAAVWAFNLPLIWQRARRGIDGIRMRDADPRNPGKFEEYYLPNKYAFVWQGDPFRMPQRIVAQSGTFLVSGNLGLTVEEILEQYPPTRGARNSREDALVIQFIFETERVRADAMASLYSLNITQSTLFPGLDGLARSMAYEFEYSWEVDLKTNELRESLKDGRIPPDLLEEKRPQPRDARRKSTESEEV
jgi:hypothetical protein